MIVRFWMHSSSDENAGGLTLAESAAKLEACRINELKNWSRLLLVSSAFTIPLVFMHYSVSRHALKYDREF
jgi:hypothetical protein